MSKNEKMHVQSVHKYCLSLSNMQICEAFVAFVIVVAQDPQLRALATKKRRRQRRGERHLKKKKIFGNCNYSAIIPCIPFQLRDVDEVLLSLTAISAVEVKTEN